MKHFILDVNIILDYWLNRGDIRAVEQLFEQNSGHTMLWVSSSSLPMAEYLYCQALKQEGVPPEEAKSNVNALLAALLEKLAVLSNHSHDITQYIGDVRDLQDAQIALSTLSLNGISVIVTDNNTFDTLGLVSTKTPGEALEWTKEKEDDNSLEFIDLKTQQDIIRPQLEKNLQKVLRHGRYIMGPEVDELEEKLADYVGVKHCIGVSSGTDALLIAMMALEIGSGDEVITTPFTFIATGEMIALLGAKPVFVDIDSRTFNIDPNKIEAAITPRTKAIMPVSLYGQCADFDAINEIAKKHGLPVIEDGCQSLGATYKGKASCGLSTIGCASFFPSKPLGGYGDSGACFTNDETLAKVLKEIRLHGQDRRYHHPRIGINGRMDTMQAAILLAKLEVFPEEVSLRQQIGDRYTKLIEGASQNRENCPIVAPYIEPHNTSVYAQYTLQVENRAEKLDKLKCIEIPTAVHYPVPLNKQPALATNNFDLSVANELSEKVMSLPMHPYLEWDDQRKIIGMLL